jgi:protoheme IX farnesyltransferase
MTVVRAVFRRVQVALPMLATAASLLAILSVVSAQASLTGQACAVNCAGAGRSLAIQSVGILSVGLVIVALVLAAALAGALRRGRRAGRAAAWASGGVAALVAETIIILMAIERRAWPVPSWLVLATTALVVAFCISAAVTTLDGREPYGAQTGVRATWREYLALTKPIIVLLLLVTTLSGLIVGGHGWPRLGVLVWTLVGGALSAGGASALNQYIDRDLDRKMQRTERRPLPGGRVTEADALAFGIVLCLAGFYSLAIAVNLLRALLAFAGMVYYVGLYSLVLKKTTPQNIVVGGGAGAIPPLVGWAAATGSLNMGAFFLFAIIFFWTPPHFWALALLRRTDYARAGVPMLPVVRGDRETRWEILLYTIQLVALTLLLPLVGDGGAFFLVAAAALGSGLIVQAWRLWHAGGNRTAWGLYRYSSMYLAFIFGALVVDTFLRR